MGCGCGKNKSASKAWGQPKDSSKETKTVKQINLEKKLQQTNRFIVLSNMKKNKK